jgi:hypothetical protein
VGADQEGAIPEGKGDRGCPRASLPSAPSSNSNSTLPILAPLASATIGYSWGPLIPPTKGFRVVHESPATSHSRATLSLNI